MTITEDLVEGAAPFWSQEWEDFLTAVGSMFAEYESYAADPDEPDALTDFFIDRPNYAPNPNFEHDQLLAAPAGWGTPALSGGALSEFAVRDVWSFDGAHSVHLKALTVPPGGTMMTAVNNSAQIPVTVGQPWRLAAAFNIMNVHTRGVLQLDFYDASGVFIETKGVTFSDVGVLGQARVITDPIVTPILAKLMTARLGITNSNNVASTIEAYADGVVLQRGWPITSEPFSGDDEGHDWEGIPGNSTSFAVPPIPQVGWSKMLDVDRADTKGLPYVAQYVGERLPVGLSDAAQRQWIRRSPNQYRGTMQAIADGIIPFLTGSQAVFMREWSKVDLTADPDWLAILTFASETPNPALIYDQLRHRLVDASVNIDYQTASRETWGSLEGGRTWAVVEAGGPTWHDVESIQPGYVPPGFVLWTPST